MNEPKRNTNLRRYDIGMNVGLFALTLAVAGGVYSLLIRPLDGQVLNAQTEVYLLKELVQQSPTINQTNRQLKQKLADVIQQADEMDKRVPVAPRESDFLAEITHIAEDVKFEIVDYHSGTILNFDSHREMEIKVNAKASYESLCRFLERVDDIPRLSRLIDLEVSTDATQEKVTVILSFGIYFSPKSESSAVNRMANR